MLILASGSPARASLLKGAGVAFVARPVAVDEAALREAVQAEGGDAAEAALLLAEAKALRVRGRELVIGADQMLVCDGEWFEKPVDLAAARGQLQRLCGRTHELVSAVVCARDGVVVWHHVARARMVMRRFSKVFLEAYLAAEGAALLGCVGAYRLEGMGVQLFDAVEGSDAVVLGLPLLPLLGFLRQHGVLLT